jgi:hypothetical protein
MSELTITPDPTDEETAAILAALVFAWPKPPGGEPERGLDPRWRFSGRWWHRPIPMARQRPWRG